MDDLEGMLDDSDCHQLLAVVTSMHHQGVGKALHNWTLHVNTNKVSLAFSLKYSVDTLKITPLIIQIHKIGTRLEVYASATYVSLPEPLCSISASSVGKVHRALLLHSDVILCQNS